MRDIANKTDNVSTLSAAEFNASIMQELENAVTNSGITLDPAGGPDTDNEMLAQAITRAAQGGFSYQDSGAADTYVLTAIGGFVQPSAYTNGMTVVFQAGNDNTGASTINVAGIGVTDLVDASGSALGAGAIVADNYYVAQYDLAGTEFRIILGAAAASTGKSVLGHGYVETGSHGSTSTGVPLDDTIWQSTEGGEALTLAYTPISSTSKLIIECSAQLNGASNYQFMGIALFKDSDADALAVSSGQADNAGYFDSPAMLYEMTSGTTSAITFKMRYGTTSGTVYLNGNSSGRRFGGVLNTYIKITEIEA